MYPLRSCYSYNILLEDGRVVDAVEVAGDVVLADVEVLELRRLQGLPLLRVVLPKDPLDVEAVAEGAFAAVEGVLLDAVQQLELKGQRLHSNVKPKSEASLKGLVQVVWFTLKKARACLGSRHGKAPSSKYDSMNGMEKSWTA